MSKQPRMSQIIIEDVGQGNLSVRAMGNLTNMEVLWAIEKLKVDMMGRGIQPQIRLPPDIAQRLAGRN